MSNTPSPRWYCVQYTRTHAGVVILSKTIPRVLVYNKRARARVCACVCACVLRTFGSSKTLPETHNFVISHTRTCTQSCRFDMYSPWLPWSFFCSVHCTRRVCKIINVFFFSLSRPRSFFLSFFFFLLGKRHSPGDLRTYSRTTCTPRASSITIMCVWYIFSRAHYRRYPIFIIITVVVNRLPEKTCCSPVDRRRQF